MKRLRIEILMAMICLFANGCSNRDNVSERTKYENLQQQARQKQENFRQEQERRVEEFYPQSNNTESNLCARAIEKIKEKNPSSNSTKCRIEWDEPILLRK